MDVLKQLKSSSSPPWANDQYFETVIDNDPALQLGNNNITTKRNKMIFYLTWFCCFFISDIEEDLNQLGDLTISKTTQEKDQLTKANERIQELEEMIETLK